MYETYYEPTEQDLRDYSKHCQKETKMMNTDVPSKEQLKDEIIHLLNESKISAKTLDEVINLVSTLYGRIPD